ncbi:DNA-binding response regulator [Actinoplanes cyaneus]|uniref:DNA-binding response regulator n=1 Tax=Actinoplanes cyaneus TaxID=52696 RepID=A0A919ILH0_9ACTN|nr:response regulator transcription factor [Actinoplanes cyaneus]MCW2140290.1 two component transcriptional regulator, LuxR family [Actinoplanes cyaneus]GID65608.1 DNA-binding response regulator [Actinoplanes cyaneus]
MTVRVVLVDDQTLVRTGFRLVLDETGDLEVVGEAADGAHALDVVARTRPDVVLMDVRMPGLDGIETTRRIRTGPHPAKVIILTTFDLDEYVLSGLRAGASGFLLKDALAADLISAVRVVAAGESVAAPSVTRRLIAHYLGSTTPAPAAADRRLATLTSREREVLTLVTRGLSNAEIAAVLVLSESTVKTHLGRILAKLGLRDRVQAVILGYECGLAQP